MSLWKWQKVQEVLSAVATNQRRQTIFAPLSRCALSRCTKGENMKRNMMIIAVVLVSAFFVRIVSAKDIQVVKPLTGQKGVTSASKKNKDALRTRKKVEAGGDSTLTNASKTVTTDSKQQHDAAEKVINNMK